MLLLPQNESVALFEGVSYTVPGLFSFSELVYRYLDIVKAKYNYEIPIKYIYGSPSNKWNGGRVMITSKDQGFLDRTNIEREISLALSYGITPLFTFSNIAVEDSDLDDELGNFILSLLNKHYGEVIVCSDVLKSYIQAFFPNIRIHASVILTALNNNRNTEYYESLSQNYTCYVVHPDDLYNKDLLKNIPKHNAEIMVNERCAVSCPMRSEHYHFISQEQKSRCDGRVVTANFLDRCSNIPEWKQAESKLRNASLTVNEIKDLITLGFRYIKLQGRTDNIYAAFFDIIRYTLENELAFTHLYPIFCYEIQKYINKNR